MDADSGGAKDVAVVMSSYILHILPWSMATPTPKIF